MNQPIYVVDGARTPFLKARNRPCPFAASDLAVQAARAPLVYSARMVLWFPGFSAAKTFGEKAGAFLRLNPAALFTPIIGIVKGLTDPMVGLLMGQTAENLAFRFGITRREMDEFSAKSHQRVLAAQKAGHFAHEIVPLYDKKGTLYAADDGVREDSTPENLAKLRPFF